MAECPDSETSTNPSRLTSNLPINVNDLLECQSVEKQRIEFKKSWNNGPTKVQVTKTVSAFANDFYNDNGGYIVIGVEEDDSEDACGQIKFPPVGIQPSDLDKIQKQIMGTCKGNISPSYSPILSPEVVEGKHVLVIWAQASDNRPHKARESEKGGYCYFIRKGVETMKATDDEIKELLESSQKVPFDDRMARHGCYCFATFEGNEESLNDCLDRFLSLSSTSFIRAEKHIKDKNHKRYSQKESGKQIDCQAINKKFVKEFLDDTRSDMERNFDRNMLEKIHLVVKCGDEKHDGFLRPRLVPRNVALLMFNKVPHEFFHGAKIEVAQFSRDKEILDEHILEGPLSKQIKSCIDLVLSTTSREQSVSSLTYPKRALREAIVNAVYHRGYEAEYNSSIKVYIRPNCLEICSYPGPHRSLKMEHFVNGKDIPNVPARNRRIGEFLKDLKLAEARGTGVNTIFKTMKENDNPEPQFDFDSSYFRVTLPAHPKFKAMMLLKEVEELEAKGDKYQASEVLQEAFDNDSSIISQNLIQKLVSLHDGRSDHPDVQKYEAYVSDTTRKRCSLLEELKKWLAENPRDYISQGAYLIRELVKVDANAQDFTDVTKFACGLSKERDQETRKPILDSNQKAHQLLEAYGRNIISSNSTLAWHFACSKYNIYTMNKEKLRREVIFRITGRSAFRSILSYLSDAKDYLEHAIVISERREEKPSFIAQLYRQLGYTLYHLLLEGKETASAYKECYDNARKLDPKIQINSFMNPPVQSWSVRTNLSRR